MGPTSLTWRGLTAATGQDQPYRIHELEGWEESPAPRYDKQPRTFAHGAHPSPVYADERIVTVTGVCWTAADRDRLLADMQAETAFGDDDTTEQLTVTAAGRTLTAQAQLIAARPALVRGQWGVGRFGWVLQWRCPDPMRYGPDQTAATALPDPSGGLTYPLAYPLDYGTTGGNGQITLSNGGSAPAPIRFAVRGPLPEGFEISAGGQRLRYPVPVPAGQVIDIDTAAGTVLVEGTASRRSNLTVADWLHIPRRGTLTVQFTSLGGARDPQAQLTATWAETHG